MDLSPVDWTHAEGAMSRQRHQPLACTGFPHPSSCRQSCLKSAERREPRNTVENTAESHFSRNRRLRFERMRWRLIGSKPPSLPRWPGRRPPRTGTLLSASGYIRPLAKGRGVRRELSHCVDASPPRALC